MLREIPFFLVMIAPTILLVVGAFGLISFLSKLVTKPKVSPLDTLVEANARKARVMAMLAQAEKSRLAHHH